jgi:hypothetical protein
LADNPAGPHQQTRFSIDESRPDRRDCRVFRRILQPERRSHPEHADLRDSNQIKLHLPIPPDPPDFSQTTIHPMIRLLSALVVSALAMLAASCCCTSDTKPPRLRPLPQFQEIPAAPAPAPEVHATK